MKKFEIIYPATLNEAALLLKEHGREARVLAGGTEVLVNMRQGLCSPMFLVSLKKIPELNYRFVDGDYVKVGSLSLLHDLATPKSEIEEDINILFHAARSVGSVQIRNQGTIGGNIFQDTRCIYYNHSNFWRESIESCLRRGGKRCHVVPGSKKCVSGYYSDIAPALMALNSKIGIVDIRSLEEQTVGIEDFFRKKLINHQFAIVKDIQIPVPRGRILGSFIKFRGRKSIGFPIMNAAISLAFENDKNRVNEAKIVIGGLPNFPKRITRTEEGLKGRDLNDGLIIEIAQLFLEEVALFSDPFLSKENKKAIMTALVRRGLEDILQRCTHEGQLSNK